VNLEGPLSPRAYCVAAALALLIAGSGTASATAFPDGDVPSGPGLFRDGFGTSMGDFTSFGVGGKEVVSSVGSDNGTEGQDRGGPLPRSFDDLKADYSSSTVDPLFPAWVTNSESDDFDLWINEQTLFGDSDYAGGLFVNVFGSRSLGLSSFESSEHRPGNGGSGACSSDDSIAGVEGCERKEELSSLIAGSPDAGSDAGYQPAQQIPNFPGSNPPFGGVNQIPGLEMKAAENSFAMTWPWGAIQGAFPPACCDVTPPVVDDSFAPPSDFVSPTLDLPSGQLGNALGNGLLTDPPSAPEIPQWAMLLIGFAGLSLAVRRRYWRWGATRSTVRTP
jgi:hypothetical protein